MEEGVKGRADRGVSTRTRFEVFKRDDFTCQYCGRGVPDVVLEVDHIVPRVEGGGNEIENLATSCFDCNRGKAGVPLENRKAVEDLTEKTALLQEREAQLRAYNEAKRQELDRSEADFEECWHYWFDLWGADKLDRWYVPWEQALRRDLKTFAPAEIMEAMQIAIERCGRRAAAAKYFGGIMRRKRLEREGRIARCTYCDGVIELDKGERDDGTWYHVDCKPEGS